MRFIFLAMLRALIVAATARDLAADEFAWSSPVSGDPSQAANWQPSGVPGANDTAVFDLGSAGYTISGNLVVQQLRFDNDTVTVTGYRSIAGGTVEPAIQFGSNAGDVSVLNLNTRLYGTQILIGAHQDSNATVYANGLLSTLVPIVPTPPAGALVVGAGGKGVLHANGTTVESKGDIILGRDASARGELYLNGGTLSALGTGLVVGQAGQGYLNVTGNGHADVSGELMVGRDLGSVGEITLTGAIARLGAAGVMTSTTIGGYGHGTISATDGAQVQLTGPIVLGRDAGGEGSLAVDGLHSFLDTFDSHAVSTRGIFVGQSGKGELSLTGGARADRLTVPVIAGQNTGAEGTITVDGAGTILASQWLQLGDAGKGTATISGGATAKFYSGISLGTASTGDGHLTITGQGTSVRGEGVEVGDHGQGELIVSDSATADFSSFSLQIGIESGAAGSVTVEKPHSRINASRIDVGGQGTATLSILNGGEVQISNSGGIVDVSAGSTLQIVDGSLFGKGQQKITLINDGRTSTNGLIDGNAMNSGTLDNRGTITGNVTNLAGGVVSGTGTIGGVLAQTGGTISPGNSPGTLEVGSLDISSGALRIEMNSASGIAGGPIGWDLIESQGLASISGPLTLELVSLTLDDQPGDVSDFDPNQGWYWTIIRGITHGSSIFDPSLITVDTSGFSNDYDGRFSVQVLGANIALVYVHTVPEPQSLLQLSLGLTALIALRRNRRIMRAICR